MSLFTSDDVERLSSTIKSIDRTSQTTMHRVESLISECASSAACFGIPAAFIDKLESAIGLIQEAVNSINCQAEDVRCNWIARGNK